MRVLLITRECLRGDSNEGNVLINLFARTGYELANIYCKPGLPDNDICTRYFQLTDKMALDNILHGTPMGACVSPDTGSSGRAIQGENKRFYDFFRKNNLPFFQFAREILWDFADFKSDALRDFISDFAPDVIFAPLCYNRFVLAMDRYAVTLTGRPAATYIYDDLYSLRQLSFSPFFWINRFIQRAAIRKTMPYFRLAYTMCEQQAREYQKYFSLPMHVISKCAGRIHGAERAVHDGLRIVYAGGLYCGRDGTLGKVSDAVRALNAEGFKLRLDVYTSSPVRKQLLAKLDDGRQCFMHGVVPSDELEKIYTESDIALHVESFTKKYALATRLSFSTKIVDCLSSGCALLAICPSMNSGWQYLRDNDAAMCIDTPGKIYDALRTLALDGDLRRRYAAQAAVCAEKHHSREQCTALLCRDLEAMAWGML